MILHRDTIFYVRMKYLRRDDGTASSSDYKKQKDDLLGRPYVNFKQQKPST